MATMLTTFVIAAAALPGATWLIWRRTAGNAVARWLLIAAAVLLVFLVFPTPFFLVAVMALLLVKLAMFGAVLAGLAWLVWWLIRSARQQTQAQSQPQPQPQPQSQVQPQSAQGARSQV